MKKIINVGVVCFFVLAVTGCSVGVGPRPPSKTNFGVKPENYQSKIKKGHGSTLKDPYSAKYVFSSSPYKAYINDTNNLNNIFWKGWAVKYNLNAKNSYGGYIGSKEYVVLFNNGEFYATQVSALMPRLIKF